MPSAKRLDAEDRALLELVGEAAFANPFSRERDDLDRRIVSGMSGASSGADLLTAVKERVAATLSRLGVLTGGTGAFDAADAQTLRTAALFHVFHRYEAAFDRSIEDQIQAGDTPVEIAFATELLRELGAIGLDVAGQERFLAIFFQLRRAFFFIGKGLTGVSASVVALRRHLWSNVFTHHPNWYERFLWQQMEDFSTLLLGETGTGKGAAAAAIGRSNLIPFERARRRFRESFTANFVATNLAQFPVTLIESELFGHKKGAFTGAIDHHQGLFARVGPHGALFLDEVGDVDAATQVKLLRVLQERTFSPVGGHERLRFAGRVIAATNRDLGELRATGQFRDDFYYRLCSDVIVVPPLRQRLAEDPSEMPVLLAQVVRASLGVEALAAVPMLEERLAEALPRGYGWPGNVRELEQAVRRIMLTGTYEGDRVRAGGAQPAPSGPPQTAAALLTAHCQALYERYGTYEEVARLVGLDRRTVRKYINTKAGAGA